MHIPGMQRNILDKEKSKAAGPGYHLARKPKHKSIISIMIEQRGIVIHQEGQMAVDDEEWMKEVDILMKQMGDFHELYPVISLHVTVCGLHAFPGHFFLALTIVRKPEDEAGGELSILIKTSEIKFMEGQVLDECVQLESSISRHRLLKSICQILQTPH
ncbi:hypothetical protein CEXT_563351 [Caerostris extrusa]|uniref:Uncharacterized protein n=1 Tax=Caerostris extrusa TaxID=172846 RepID=A0AAV4XE57_CAEEX|nr:hypothetical protein CEXT_563351 [Caerostris extrusa]